jgi:hypothetical protein
MKVLSRLIATAAAAAFTHGDPSLPPDATIPVSTYSTGSLVVNGISSQFANPAGTVFLSNNWGATGVKYLGATDITQFIFSTTISRRDVSVTSFGSDCAFFLRVNSGKAIEFRYNYNTGTPNGHGTLQIGIVTGLGAGTLDFNRTFYGIYQNNDLLGTVAGYDPTNTTGAAFTFSVQGFNICAKYNSTVITCFQDYRYTSPGIVQAQCNTSTGIRDTTIHYFPAPPMYSNPQIGLYDVRDFGGKAVATTGSIPAASNSLTVASSANLSIGDQIIVATGGEAATGRGTIGVGGALPTRTYPDLATANADLPNQADGAWMRTLNDEAVYRKFTTWISYAGTEWYQTFSNPVALVAHITGISGNTLTLDQSAVVGATNAGVYFDNGIAYWLTSMLAAPSVGLEPLTPLNVTINFPCGTFAIYSGSGTQTFAISTEKVNWTITGQGACTTLLTPTGVRSFSAQAAGTGTIIQNLTLRGNAQDVGYAVDFRDADVSGGGMFLPAMLLRGINDQEINVSCINVFADCLGSNFATNPYGTNVSATLTDGIRSYTQWQFQIANSFNGGCNNCSLSSPFLVAGFESFSSTNIIYNGITSQNGVFSCNSASNTIYEDLHIIITANSQLDAQSFSADNPIFNMNANISGGMPTECGTIMHPFSVVQQGYINAANDSLTTVSVSSSNANFSIIGDYPISASGCFQAPNYAGTNPFRGIGVRNDGTTTTISGIRIIGHADYAGGVGNIQSEGGSLTVTNSIMDDSVQGGAPFAETGTQSNATWNLGHPGQANCPP